MSEAWYDVDGDGVADAGHSDGDTDRHGGLDVAVSDLSGDGVHDIAASDTGWHPANAPTGVDSGTSVELEGASGTASRT